MGTEWILAFLTPLSPCPPAAASLKRRSLDDWRQHVRLSPYCRGAAFPPRAPRVLDGPENSPYVSEPVHQPTTACAELDNAQRADHLRRAAPSVRRRRPCAIGRHVRWRCCEPGSLTSHHTRRVSPLWRLTGAQRSRSLDRRFSGTDWTDRRRLCGLAPVRPSGCYVRKILTSTCGTASVNR
jgi:hypothetical protein